MVGECTARNWMQLNGTLHVKWDKLTDNTLVLAGGRRERLVELLLQHYGYGRARAENELDELAATTVGRETATNYQN